MAAFSYRSLLNSAPAIHWSAGALQQSVPVGLSNLVEEFVHGLADLFQPSGLRHRQIRMTDKPAFCLDLVPGDPVLRFRAANPRPAFASRKDDVHFIGYLRREVVDIGVPLVVVGSREDKLRVVVHENETHVVKRANLRPSAEVALQQPQNSAQPLGYARSERDDEEKL